MTKNLTRINFWSSPRNISTALMYSFAQRPDTNVVDEPLYAAYLHRFPELDHPGRSTTVKSQSTDPQEVIDEVLCADEYSGSVVLFKQMTHHLEELSDWSFSLDMKNVLLIRDPRAIIASYSKVIPNPTIQDVGIALQARLHDYLLEHGKLAAILDAGQLLRNPGNVLSQLCKRLDIPFYESMLSWQAGKRIEDGAWAPYWYTNVHQSTGFLPFEEKIYQLSPPLEALAQQCEPYYKTLFESCLKPQS